MVPAPISIALIGYGKIAADQHVPAIHANPDFTLAAVVSARGAGPEGVPVFRDLDELLASGIACDAVAHCNTPAAREASARAALAAGKHSMLEKPPATDPAAWARIAAAHRPGVTLMTGWHSQANAAVAAARVWLADKRIRHVALDWREDVRKWHPGQEWIWEAGGFGVFDPGINGLSIATAILPFVLELQSARLEVPANRAMPIAARLNLGGQGWDGTMRADFDWRETTGECWRITVETDAGTLRLDAGGRRLVIDGALVQAHGDAEYPTLYRQFAHLVRQQQSHIDVAPLMLVCDALASGERHGVAGFFDEG
jgi:predicted dehydrogenase